MTNTVTLNANELHDLVQPILPLAGKDDTLPVLCHLVIRGVGRQLTCHATDRYRMGIKRVEIVHADQDGKLQGPLTDGFEAVISRYDLTTILRLFPRTRDYFTNDQLQLTVGPGHDALSRKLTVQTTTHNRFRDLQMSFDLYEGDYPNVSTILDGFGGAEPTEVLPFALNPQFLADFRVAVDRNEPLRFFLGKSTHKPIYVTAGDSFLGIIMPIRTDHEAARTRSEMAADWRPFLPPKPDDKKDPKTAAPPPRAADGSSDAAPRPAASDEPAAAQICAPCQAGDHSSHRRELAGICIGCACPETPVATCRGCGCTDDDCTQCIERTGQPCHWVEKDLCSACASTATTSPERAEAAV